MNRPKHAQIRVSSALLRSPLHPPDVPLMRHMPSTRRRIGRSHLQNAYIPHSIRL